MKEDKPSVNISDEISDKKMFENFFGIERVDIKEADIETLFKWKTNIWDKCKYKKKKDEPDDIIYLCTLCNKNCVFRNCPRK